MLVRAIKPFDKKQPGTVFDTTSFHASELIRNGMAVEHKMKAPPANKMAATPQNKGSVDAGKAPAAGVDQPSSVSQAAPVSPSPTSNTSASGARPTLRLRKPRAKRSQ